MGHTSYEDYNTLDIRASITPASYLILTMIVVNLSTRYSLLDQHVPASVFIRGDVLNCSTMLILDICAVLVTTT